MRQMVLIPTGCMTADSLTKPMIHDSMLLLLYTGKVKFYNVENHPVKGRVLPALQDYDERDIVKTDEEILQETKNDKVNLKICHSTILLGYFAMKSYMPLKFVAAASLMTAAHAMDPMEMARYEETVVKVQADVDYTSIYVMIFITVVIAVNFERFMQYVIKKITTWRTTSTTRVKQEVKQEINEPVDMDVDETFLDQITEEDTKRVRMMKRKLYIQEEEIEDYKITMKVRDDALNNMQEQLDEVKRDRLSWESFSQTLSAEIEKLKVDKQSLSDDYDDLEKKWQRAIQDRNMSGHNEEKWKEKFMDLNDKFEKLQQQATTNHSNWMRSSMETNNLKAQLSDVRKEKGDLKQQLETARAEKAMLEREKTERANRLFGPDSDRAGERIFAPDDRTESDLRRQVGILTTEKLNLQGQYNQLNERFNKLQEDQENAKAPAKVYATRNGSCYHKQNCQHVQHGINRPNQVEFSRCRTCFG